ncbi:MAG: copper amine oxidase N-terminal domain-containing protein [Oscillospiraceae bacterium]|nr:copper amine oxidase N-terminal domain-containing protein [Oscillospiraceae bacterium]
MNRFGKRALTLFLSLLMLVPLCPFAAAADESGIEYILLYNGEIVDLGVTSPRILEGGWEETLHLPLRVIADAMGAEVGYDKGLVSVTYNGTTLSFDIFGDIEQGTITNADGTVPYLIEPMPMVIDGRTLIAAETLEEVFGMLVSWHWNHEYIGFNPEYEEKLNELVHMYLDDEILWEHFRLLQSKLYADYYTGHMWDISCTISVIDLAGLLEGVDGRFTVFNELLDAFSKAMEPDLTLNGTLTGQVELLFLDDYYYGDINGEYLLPFEREFSLPFPDSYEPEPLHFDMGLDFFMWVLEENGYEIGEDSSDELYVLMWIFLYQSYETMLSNQNPPLNLIQMAAEKIWMSFLPGANGSPPLTVSQMLEEDIRARAKYSYYSYYGFEYEDIQILIGRMEAYLGDDNFTVSGDEEGVVITWKLTLKEILRKQYEMWLEIDSDEINSWFADFDEYYEDYMLSYDDTYELKAVFAFDENGAMEISLEYRLVDEYYWEIYEWDVTIQSAFPGETVLTIHYKMFDYYDDSEFIIDLTLEFWSEPS